jgi:hypothetical protein
MMVSIALILGIASRGAAGKIIALWFPVVVFVVSSYEHCVANSKQPWLLPILCLTHACICAVIFCSLGLIYGAPSTIGRLWYNQSAAVCGNIVGGVIFIALTEHLMNHWQSPIFRKTQPGIGTLAAHDVESSRRARDVVDIHPADVVAHTRSLQRNRPREATAARTEQEGEGSSHIEKSSTEREGGVPRHILETSNLHSDHNSIVESLASLDTTFGECHPSLVGHDEALERRKVWRALLVKDPGAKRLERTGKQKALDEKTDASENV